MINVEESPEWLALTNFGWTKNHFEFNSNPIKLLVRLIEHRWRFNVK